MKGLRFRSHLALAILGVTSLTVILALALTGGPQRLAHPPARAQGQLQCGTGTNLVEWEAAVVDLKPDSGFRGTPFEVDLSHATGNEVQDQPAEVLWDWSAELRHGEVIGSGTIPKGQTSVNMAATVPEDAQPGGHTVTACWYRAASDTWYYRSTPFEVSEVTPTPTPTPGPATPTRTPTPTPSPANQVHNCPKAGNWAIAVWEGANGVDTGEALATCGEQVDAVYALDPDTQEWLRYFPGRGDISDLLTLKDKQGLIVRAKATLIPTPTPGPATLTPTRTPTPTPAPAALTPTPTPTPTPAPAALTPTRTPTPTPAPAVLTPTRTPTPTPAPANQMHNCPKAGKWAIAVWEGADGIDTGEALATCGEEVDAVYALDPDTQEWLRYFPERRDISDLLTLKDKQGLIARGKATLIPTPTPAPATLTPTPTPTPTPAPAALMLSSYSSGDNANLTSNFDAMALYMPSQ
ncbi:MAG: hypothetical protein ABSB57_00675 [Dehalococcoidia bacterium]